MGVFSQASVRPAPIPLERHAAEQLHFIRNTMERASVFTVLPGAGGIVIGFTALLTGVLAQGRPVREQLTWWVADGALAVLLGAIALWWKARRMSQSLTARPAKRALFSFAVPLFAGALLTAALYRLNEFSLFAGLWLLLYGVAIVAAGAHSVRIVPVMGLCFVALGSVALFAPASSGNLWMCIGFAGLHIAFGWMIARKHGG